MSVLSPFLKIGLTVAVLAFSENLLLEISSFIISAEILTNLAEIPSGPFALLIFRDLIIWFMSLALAKGNFLSIEKFPFNFLNTGMRTDFDIIWSIVASSYALSSQCPKEDDLFPDDISTIFMYVLLKNFTSTFSSLTMSPSFSILMQSFVMQPLFVKKGFTVFQKVIPLLVASLKNFLLAFLVMNYICFWLLCNLQISPAKVTLHNCF